MKKVLRYMMMPACLFVAGSSFAQNDLAADQNPNYMASQQRYMQVSDSLTALEGTTPQETYKAIDYLADKREARAERKAFRQELRLERARYGYYGDSYYYGPGYNDYYYNDYYPYRWRSGWHSDWSYALPLALTAFSIGRWCR